MNSKPKAVKDWEDTLRALGCIITGQNDVQLHHVHGRTYKNNKVLIGPWFILPLCWDLHDVFSDKPQNVTHYPKKFALKYGLQKDIFLDMCDNLENDGIILPFGDDVLESIRNTSK